MYMFDVKKTFYRVLSSIFAMCCLVVVVSISAPVSIAIAADPASATPSGPAAVAPKLGVDIPGVNLATGQVAETGKVLYESYLATYIAGVYKYILGIVVIAAALMMIYGGFKYILSSSLEGVADGKKNIVNAVIGLILTFGSYTILAMLNPALVELKPLEIPIVEPLIYKVPEAVYQRLQDVAAAQGCTASPVIKQAVAAAVGGTKPATRMNPKNPFDPRMTLPIEELNKILDKAAKDAGVDPCILKAIAATESGRRQNAVGHDEDANKIQYQSRLDFLRSGITFLKTSFTPAALPEKCNKSNADTCNAILKGYQTTTNDDDMTAIPPDYGLDWRFSHGFGYGQFTIFPRTSELSCVAPDGSVGRRMGETCYTAPCVMTWEGQTAATVQLLKGINETDACKIFQKYSGERADTTCTGRLQNKMDAYKACKGGAN